LKHGETSATHVPWNKANFKRWILELRAGQLHGEIRTKEPVTLMTMIARCKLPKLGQSRERIHPGADETSVGFPLLKAGTRNEVSLFRISPLISH
jgi:hypothetical protein